MKKILCLLTLITSFSYAQNPTKFLSYNRSYYTNEAIVSSYTDKLSMKYDFKNKYTLRSDFSKMSLNLIRLETFDDEDIQDLYSLDFTIDKEYILKKGWSLNLGVNPQLRSNLIGSAHLNEFLINGYAKVNREFKDKSTLSIAAVYGTLWGKPQPYLEFAYGFKVHEKINLSIGFPKSFIEYRSNKSNSFALQCQYESYYTNLSNNSYSRVLEGQILNYKSLFISKINTAFVYQHDFSNSSVIDFSIGKSFRNQLEIKESNNRETKEEFHNTFTVALGFKYNLNFK